MRFNPRTRVGCDTAATRKTASCSGFNPRTRVGCDGNSILAAAPSSMFQSTHPRGVRLKRKCTCFTKHLFQSTHPRGVRPDATESYGFRRIVSIHAPAWGATGHSSRRPTCGRKFQSTHPRGVRHDKAVAAEAAIAFQSTHPRGVRPARWYCMACQDRVSIHAPAWGATRRPRGHHELLYVSIHAPAWGATEHRALYGSRYVVSIHAPAWGATLGMAAFLVQGGRFQSTHPRGVRPARPRAGPRPAQVSIHAPAWGATCWARRATA